MFKIWIKSQSYLLKNVNIHKPKILHNPTDGVNHNFSIMHILTPVINVYKV